MLPVRTEVLVVGAGPTGLALAAVLQKAGVDHVLIDALDGPQNTSRAAVVHAHTLEMLEAVDAVAPLTAASLPLTKFTVRDRDQPLLTVDFSDLPSAYRHMLMAPQSTTEAVLLDQFTAHGGELHRSVSAVDARADADGAVVRVLTAQGERSIRARYVIGADGMHSAIREAAGIPFHGEAYGESFVLADVRMDWPLGPKEVSLFFSPAGLVVVAPLPGGSYRIVATLENAPESPGIADMQRLLDSRGPTTEPSRISEVVWSSRFRVHHRLAAAYRRGPFLLMGDAAHVHSPAGGQGMNTGLADAVVLGGALVQVLRNGAPEALLDDYSRVRRAAAKEVLTLASRLTHIATVRSPLLRRIRNLVLRRLDRAPGFKAKLSLGLSGLSRRRYAVLPAYAPPGPVSSARSDRGRDRARPALAS